ncbi:hypothetical protein EFK50_15720 [Nocardioides marmoriginsengisoli]|uniref:Uncharacterized protein n=1 Tax=Nocardioides marmoriginsengisoli TaxID=661483 RepID=A0A3N0CI87_9ACTN|nr:hypothetical protein [Nocardioides marmoriginsengisoli]RNL63152.1 hypothetical protein EFK50_15720 [Nocardioides marmoriginsengisoli]
MWSVRKRDRRVGAGVGAVLLVSTAIGLIGGAALRLPGAGSDARASVPAAGPRAPSAAPLQQGTVVVDDAVGDLTTEVALGRTRTPDGAVAAFAGYAAWLIGSPAAAADPSGAVRAVGGASVNPADAQLLAGMQRVPGDDFAAESGAYRVLGLSGDARAPAEVMVEVAAPLTVAGTSRWSRVGGVVAWTPSGWRVVSIRPGELPQPEQARTDVRTFTAEDRARTLAGLGWRAFARGTGR